MRPFVFINVAISADGKMDTFERKGVGISSEVDKKRVLELRAEADAIMVGGHTLLDEDPKLTVKTEKLQLERKLRGQPENPIKVGIVSRANIKLDGNFMTAGPARRIIFSTTQTNPTKVRELSEHGVEVYILGEKRVNLIEAFDKLFFLGIHRLMVEGGGTLNFELLRLGLVDELFIYMAPKLFGGETSPTLAAGAGLNKSSGLDLKLIDVHILDDSGGLLIRYQISK